jgi:threonine synthase
MERLSALGAELVSCPRDGRTPGDPCYHRFREAVAEGALPFTVQGNENGLTVEGGMTLAWELVSDLAAAGAGLDRLFVQVGGGALASACIQGLFEARAPGPLAALPRVHTAQTRGAWPLKRAYNRVAAAVLARWGSDGDGAVPPDDDDGRSLFIRDRVPREWVEEELHHAVRHRSGFMWPWESEPRSIAHGILDDETYDWAAVVWGMLVTGGYPLVVSEEALADVNHLARERTGIPVDPTGSAGFAGLVEAARGGGLRGERAAVLMTGRTR